MTLPTAIPVEIPPFREKLADGSWQINFNRPQTLLMVSQAQIPGMQCGAQSGKTTALVEWLAQEMDNRGPGDYMFVSPTYPLMERKAISELRERFTAITGGAYIHQPGYKRFISQERIDGNPAYTIMLGSAVNPDSLESATLKGIAIDELAQSSFPREAWEALQRRAAINKARIAFGTTLYDVSSWYKVEIYDKWKNGDPRFDIIQADSIENPAFPLDAYEQAREDLPWWKFNMFYRGIYEKPTGLIYDCFNEETQVIDGFNTHREQYKDWIRFTGHDFGPNNTACLWFLQDPATGWVYLYREYLRGDGLSIGQHVEQFKKLSEGEQIRARTGGAAGKKEEEIRYAYLSAGWPINGPGIEGVEAGILQVYSFIARNQLFVFRDCHGFLNEILTYTRKLDDNYEVTEEIQDKSRFHRMDCLRYGLSNVAPERSKLQRAPMGITYDGGNRRHPGRRRGRRWVGARR